MPPLNNKHKASLAFVLSIAAYAIKPNKDNVRDGHAACACPAHLVTMDVI